MSRHKKFFPYIASFAAGHRGKSIALLLIAELFLAQLAIASPSLHNWMHGVEDCEHHTENHSENNSDSQSNEGHACTITLISDSLYQEAETCEISKVKIFEAQACYSYICPGESAIARHSARSPPQL